MRRRHGKRRVARRCFSLIEIMIVVVIIGLIMGLVGPNIIKKLERARHDTARMQIKMLEDACKDYYLDMQQYPERLENLVESNGSPKWDGPYIDAEELPLDPWGESYEYSAPQGSESKPKITYTHQEAQ